MRFQAFCLAVIALALAAIAAGYASAVRVQPVSAPHGVDLVQQRGSRNSTAGAAIDDEFSNDDVVIERPVLATSHWLGPQLSVVVGLCGDSLARVVAFERIGVPLAFDVDPAAPQAQAVVRAAHAAGDLVLLHVSAAPAPGELARLHARFGDFGGIASQSNRQFVQSLDGTGMLFFDERGNADASEFRSVGINVAQRDATVDNRASEAYIRFMLERAAQRSRIQGRLVVLMRPLAPSADALQSLVSARSVQFVALTQQ